MNGAISPKEAMPARWVNCEEDAKNGEWVQKTLLDIFGTEDVTVTDVRRIERSDEFLVTVCRNGTPLRYPSWHIYKNKTLRLNWIVLRPAGQSAKSR